jgi:MFS family permease
MKISVVEGAFATIHLGLTGGAFLTGYALFLGAGEISLGMLAAIPFAAQTFQLASAYIVQRTGLLKPLAVSGQALARVTWIFPIILALLPLAPGPHRVFAFMVFFAISSAFLMMTYNAWTVWMGELIPQRLRGRYFGIRNGVVIAVNLAATVAGGRMLDAFKAAGGEGKGFATVFGVAVAAAAGASLFLMRQPAAAPPPAPFRPFWRRVAEPFGDGNFRKVLRFFAAWHFAWAIPLAFWNVYMLSFLGMTYFQIALFGGVVSLVAVAGNRFWGLVADRAGNKPVLALCAVGISFLPFFWCAARPHFMYPVFFIPFWAGFCWSGFNLATFTLPLALSPRESRTYFIAAFGIVTGVATFAASTAGGVTAHIAAAYEWKLAGLTFNHYHLLFVLSAVGRLLSIGLLRPLKEAHAVGVPTTLSYVGTAIYHRLAGARQVFPDWVRMRRRNADD